MATSSFNIGDLNSDIAALNSKIRDLTGHMVAPSTMDTNDTYQIPDLSSKALYIIVARRYGYGNSISIPLETITQGGVQHFIMDHTSQPTDGTEISISSTGLLKIENTVSPVFVEIFGIGDITN